ncbi:putative secreted protein [Aliiruegeria haliotis]|uniref:Putative secreted protein n=1 Tax=Aliiruegeria haliotis TaxID=1280846 RepID=A0A2T0RYX8_9RHOB|nr:VPLPA-CTERM sorting domain-containing protein [Aliiruegeria haliotis]PRY26375.1 putative secreted protein [Aliiruegeria haliotis]
MFVRSFALALSLAMAAGAADAATITQQDFSTPPPIAAAKAPGVWYTDRYAPSGFTSQSFMGDERLALTLSSSDGGTSRPSSYSSSFYNTQGRKYDIDGAGSVSVDFFVDSGFENVSGRTGGFWLTAVDAGDGIVDYPIFEFFDNQFQVWSGGGWNAVGTQSGFAFGEFVTMSINLDIGTDSLDFLINGESLFTAGASAATDFTNVILQGINTDAGLDRTLYFDNLLATTVAPVPVPAGLPLLAIGVGALGFAVRRRRR